MPDQNNALFAGREVGAENWVLLASTVTTCKLNDANAAAYIADTIPIAGSNTSCRGDSGKRPASINRALFGNYESSLEQRRDCMTVLPFGRAEIGADLLWTAFRIGTGDGAWRIAISPLKATDRSSGLKSRKLATPRQLSRSLAMLRRFPIEFNFSANFCSAKQDCRYLSRTLKFARVFENLCSTYCCLGTHTSFDTPARAWHEPTGPHI